MNNVVSNPFGSSAPQAAGSSAATSDHHRAIAEIQAAMVIAQQNPRNQIAAMDRILNSCTRPSLANAAIYNYAKGGQDVSGPTVRLAETIAQQWGNIKFGFSEMSRGQDRDGVGYSDVKAFAWDLETNTERPLNFRVRHWIDTKSGGRKTRDEREIYELVANMAQRRVRSCVLSIIPGDVTEAAVDQCAVTMHATADTSQEAVQKLVSAFASIGVTKAQVEARIQRRIDAIQPAQIVSLRKIYASIKDGMSGPDDWFSAEQDDRAKKTGAQGLKSVVNPGAARKDEPSDAEESDRLNPDEKQPQTVPQQMPKEDPATQSDWSEEDEANARAAEAAEAAEQQRQQPAAPRQRRERGSMGVE